MLKWLLARTAGKKQRAVRAPAKKKTKNEAEKTKKFANFVERHLHWSRLIAVYFRPFSNEASDERP